eukprot:1710689-Pyramimonas_sp.AAC.1
MHSILSVAERQAQHRRIPREVDEDEKVGTSSHEERAGGSTLRVEQFGTEISIEHPLNASSWRIIPELFNVWGQFYESISYGCGWGMKSM